MAITKKRKMNIYQNPTAQGALVTKANKFGNRGLALGQGSTVVVYDSLSLPAGVTPQNTEIRFFEDAGSRSFPLTNLMEGRLPVGEGFVLERIWFNILKVADGTGSTNDVLTFEAAGVSGLYKADFSFHNANNRVIKPTPLTKMKSQWNWKAWSAVNEVIHLDTDITIQPMIEFVCSLKVPQLDVPVVDGFHYYISCYLEGAGAILNPRANF